ncbi:MAG TPA: NAD(P)-dependent oxidoreductase [Candidatus Sulfotelmatobacter sp.]|nr:NAD(P)-dependent oxidoreductase [Candidatus Sulfotelmatobacter sp.]
MQHLLITGASGGIGRRMRKLLQGAYRLRLSDRMVPNDAGAAEEFVAAELTDLAAVEAACAGIDGILHLGGMSVENDWPTILQSNIVGTYNLFEAARRQGVRRVVFASSNHAIGYYRRSRRIDNKVQPRPDSRYGVSKVFGEALGALYADKHGLGVLCIRIGNVDDRPVDKRRLSIWIHPEDLAQLVRIGLDHPALHYEVVYGASDNERSWWDNGAAERLGYRPRHRAEDHRESAMAAQTKLPPDPIGDLFQGGSFAAAEFSGDLDRI